MSNWYQSKPVEPMKTRQHPTVWLGDAGPWLARRAYYKIGDVVWSSSSYTQEHYVDTYENWLTSQSGVCEENKFRGAPDGPINPWTSTEHFALWNEPHTVPSNPWGRQA